MPSPNFMIQFPFVNVYVVLNSTKLVFLIMGLGQLLFLSILFLGRKRVYSLLKHHTAKSNAGIDHQFDKPLMEKSEKISIVADDQQILRRGDAELVLRSLGVMSGDVKEDDLVKLDSDHDIYDIFEGNKNPGLDEVREAFDVFDHKKDGFIDEDELQKVMCDLSLKEGFEVENCRMMIRAFDEDGDARINFSEFVRLLMKNIIL